MYWVQLEVNEKKRHSEYKVTIAPERSLRLDWSVGCIFIKLLITVSAGVGVKERKLNV